MNRYLKKITVIGLVLMGAILTGCFTNSPVTKTQITEDYAKVDRPSSLDMEESPCIYEVEKDIKAKDYFKFMDALVLSQNAVLGYEINEYHIARTNPKIMDAIAATDYYVGKAAGISIDDPKEIVILKKGASLNIPSEEEIAALNKKMANTVIDVNIPEFKLRILEGTEIVHEFDVRVGKNTSRYLAMVGRDVSLKTQPGVGTITRIAKDAKFINPRDNKVYKVTRRDDGVVTKLPNVPWLEPSLNGTRYGHLIHPTTNNRTLGKAYSNGCIGTSEAAGWYIYFHAPIGTKVQFRYDLEVSDSEEKLKDIYPGFEKRWKRIEAKTQV